LQELESRFAEPLHEYSQFAQIIRKLLLYRRQKHLQYEMTQASIETKKVQLAELERVEAEAARLASALSNGGRERLPPGFSKPNYSSPPAASSSREADGRTDAESEERESELDDSQVGTISSREEGRHSPESEPPELPSYNAPVPKRRAPGMGLLNALSYTIHGMMDVDPETARRNNITKTREGIAQVRQNPVSLRSLLLT
jgi:sorting nexin-41/42